MGERRSSISRREFGKRTSLAMGAVAGFNIVKAYGANNDPLKIALIGCGGRGTGAVGDAIARSENISLIGVYDIVEHKAKGAVEGFKKNENLAESIQVDPANIFFGVDGYKNLIALKPDYVILATPPGFRPMHFEAVVEANLNCFCEKPVATDATGMRRFMAAAKKSEEKGLQIVTGTQRRHQKNYMETVQKIHDGAYGELLAGRAYWNGSLPHARKREEGMSDLEYQASHNWYNYVWICGDNIVEQHVHNLDVMNWVFGAHPVSCVASGGRSWKPIDDPVYGNIWDNFSCDFVYPNGQRVFSFCRHLPGRAASEVSEYIYGTKKSGDCSSMGEDGINPYQQEHIDLQNAIRGNGPKYNEAMQVAESVFTAILGRMAAYSGQDLKWDDALAAKEDLFPKELSFDAKIPVAKIAQPTFRYEKA